MKKTYGIIPWVIIIISFVPTLLGLIHQGFFVSDDANWMVIRFSAFYEAIRHGQFPVRFLYRLNHGYGYPVSDFLYPLFMYLGVFIKATGVGFVATIKFVFAFSVISSGVGMYLWLKKFSTRTGAMLGALCFVYFPYHLFDIYTRGSIGEVLALAVIPFIFWQIERKSVSMTGFLIGLFFLAHNTLALLFLPVIVIYMYLRAFLVREILISFLLGLGISCFFWLPAVVDQQVTVFALTPVSDIAQYFITFKSLTLHGWITLLILGMVSITWGKIRDRNTTFFVLVFLISACLTLSFSEFIWKLFHFDKLVQFAFRFLSVGMLALSYLLARSFATIPRQTKIFSGIVILLIILYSAQPYLYPKAFQDYPDGYYTTNQDTTTVKNEYMSRWVKHIPDTSASVPVEIIRGQGMIERFSTNGNKLSFVSVMKTSGVIRIAIMYFPGWQVFIDNKAIDDISYHNDFGVMEFHVPQGTHTIHASFGETPLRLVSDVISLLSFLILIVFAFRNLRQSKKQ